MNVDYWAQISRDDGTSHGATLTSPPFAAEKEMFAWVKGHMRAGDEVQPWMREIIGDGFRDVSLTARDEAPPNPERLAALIAQLRLKIEESRGELRAYARQGVRTAAERGKEARDRLVRAGQAVKTETRGDDS